MDSVPLTFLSHIAGPSQARVKIDVSQTSTQGPRGVQDLVQVHHG